MSDFPENSDSSEYYTEKTNLLKKSKQKSNNISPINHDMIRDSPNDAEYHEPVFASVLRSIGCFFGYACMPTYGMCGQCYPYKSINKGSKGVIQEFGRFKREIPDGMHYVNPVTEKISEIDMKIKVIDLGKKNVMTSDKLSIQIDSAVYYKIIDVQNALFKIDNVVHAIIELSYATLRNVIGNSTLETCLSKRDTIAELIKTIVKENIDGWGIEIISIQITDIIVPHDIITSLSSTVVAEREAKAKIIIAKGNVESAILMREAADILNSQAAMQVRSLEVIDKIANSANTKIIFLPSDLDLRAKEITGNVSLKEI
ncbi:stomatin family protein/prohibitin-family membrane protease subunit ybbk [Cotonvirus japonicus]|uniref:Stomatin family protein/prohibitin-family membrane protease subunit ybbk n=1 Tax=Cotonvirus japonicus TaxID=2811091 RepID=A0ABM7NTD6_9VIRU|nr:stomatin family protein/prohibitin-family membrane protease subunit ybbk [Cotonvirus japonicus]BCS83434.1 stomatin family protein/prohibitin-family membrane protease subunit ybbk [Cotonvirus japonicus]